MDFPSILKFSVAVMWVFILDQSNYGEKGFTFPAMHAWLHQLKPILSGPLLSVEGKYTVTSLCMSFPFPGPIMKLEKAAGFNWQKHTWMEWLNSFFPHTPPMQLFINFKKQFENFFKNLPRSYLVRPTIFCGKETFVSFLNIKIEITVLYFL